jgi:small subunit ribosomal protein S1
MSDKTTHDEAIKFAELFEASMANNKIAPGAIIIGTVVDVVKGKRVTVNAGLKSDAIIPIEEFSGEEVAVGDEIEVSLESLENGFGEARLSRKNARRAKVWGKLMKMQESQETVYGKIIDRVKGGFTVDLESVFAFLPGSLVDTRPVRDLTYLEGKELEFKIIKMDLKRNNIVVSRRAVIEGEQSVEKSNRIDLLEEGQEVTGIVKNITDYGAFIDLSGLDGLLHITDISWKRVKHPSEALEVGQEIKVRILKVDKDKQRVSLGLKQLNDDPWTDISTRYPIGNKIKGHISNVTDYGCFVELENGVEGLVHMSEMDWTNRNVHPSKVVTPGQEVEVMVLDVDEARRRVSLGLKQCQINPWIEFSEVHKVGDNIKGVIRSTTDFGIFVGLNGSIDGLIHVSDLSWQKLSEEELKEFSKGQEIEAVILSIDADRERVSLGVKQLTDDPTKSYMDEHGKGEVIQAKVISVEAKTAILEVEEGVNGQLHISEYSYDHVKSLEDEIKAGDVVDVRIIGKDEKEGLITLSRKATLPVPEKPRVTPQANVKMTLGDLLKEQIDSKNDDKK